MYPAGEVPNRWLADGRALATGITIVQASCSEPYIVEDYYMILPLNIRTVPFLKIAKDGERCFFFESLRLQGQLVIKVPSTKLVDEVLYGFI